MILKNTIRSLWSPYNYEETQSRPMMRRMMIPLSGLIVLIALGFGVLVYQQYQHYLYDTSIRNVNKLTSDMDVLLDQQASGMLLTIAAIASDPRVIEMVRERDSQKLLMQWQEIFETMKEKGNSIVHAKYPDVQALGWHRADRLPIHALLLRFRYIERSLR